MLSFYFFSHLLGFAIFVTSQKKCGCTVTVAMSFYRLNYLSAAAAALFLKQTNGTRAPHSRRNLMQGKLMPRQASCWGGGDSVRGERVHTEALHECQSLGATDQYKSFPAVLSHANGMYSASRGFCKIRVSIRWLYQSDEGPQLEQPAGFVEVLYSTSCFL